MVAIRSSLSLLCFASRQARYSPNSALDSASGRKVDLTVAAEAILYQASATRRRTMQRRPVQSDCRQQCLAGSACSGTGNDR